MSPLERLGDVVAAFWGALAALVLGGLLVLAVCGSCYRAWRRLAKCLRGSALRE